MDWADDTAYSLNDLADSVRAGFLTVGKVEKWAEENGVEEEAIDKLISAIRNGRIEPFVGSRIGKYVRAAKLEKEVNFLTGTSNRYAFKVVIDEAVRAESKIFKKLAYEVVFLSPSIDGQDFHLLNKDDAEEIEAASDENERARLVCDFLAGMTDGFATRMYRRLFEPGFGSIGDLIG